VIYVGLRVSLARSVGNDNNVQVTTPELTTRKVAETALVLLDLVGPESLNLDAVAAEIGVRREDVRPFVSHQGDLIDLACDQVYSEIDLNPSSTNWPERLRHYARSFRRSLLSHPKAVLPMATRPILSESSMSVAERALGELTDVGFSPEAANRVLIVIVSFVLGHALTEVGPAYQSEIGMSEVDQERVKGFRESLPSSSLPISAEALAEENDREAEFELGLKLIVDGLERQLLHA
jgi:hypothetical protein